MESKKRKFASEDLEVFVNQILNQMLTQAETSEMSISRTPQDAELVAFILSEEPPQLIDKPIRINGVSKHLALFNDPKTRDLLETRAALLGLPLEKFMSRFYDFFIETAMNLTRQVEVPKEYRNQKTWGNAFFRKYQDAGIEKVRIFRLPKDVTSEVDPDGRQEVLVFQNESDDIYTPKRCQIELAIPEELHPQLFGPDSKEIFQTITREQFLRHLFSELLIKNGIEEPKAKRTTKEFYTEVNRALDLISRIETWKPYGFRSPPILHSLKELDNEGLIFSELPGERRGKTYQTFFNVEPIVARTHVVSVPLKMEHDDFDSFRFFLPFVQERLWRDRNDFFTILLLSFIRTHGLSLYPFSWKPIQDFKNKFLLAIHSKSLSDSTL